jgi:hypothetical protein
VYLILFSSLFTQHTTHTLCQAQPVASGQHADRGQNRNEESLNSFTSKAETTLQTYVPFVYGVTHYQSILYMCAKNNDTQYQGYQTYGTRAQSGTRHSLMSQYFFVAFDRPAPLYSAECAYVDWGRGHGATTPSQLGL